MKRLLAIFAALSVFLVACGGPVDEKQAFIDATVEATCMVFQSDNIFDPSLEDKAKEIYSSYGFDADDDVAMTALTEKYQDDEDVQAAITAALEDCAGDFMSAFEDMEMDMEMDDTMTEDEGVVEDVMEDVEATEEAAG